MKKKKKTPTLAGLRKLDNQATRIRETVAKQALEYVTARCPYRPGDIITIAGGTTEKDQHALVVRVESVFRHSLEKKGDPIEAVRWGLRIWPFRKDKPAQLCRQREFLTESESRVRHGCVSLLKDISRYAGVKEVQIYRKNR